MSELNPESSIAIFSEALGRLYRLIVESIIPSLKSIQENQVDQRQQSEWLSTNMEEFRMEMQQRFAELHAELAATRMQLEDAMMVIREQKAASGHKTLVH
jgi:hypothetical protein